VVKKEVAPEVISEHEDYHDHVIPLSQMAQKIPSLIDIEPPTSSGNLFMWYNLMLLFQVTMLFAVTPNGTKRVMVADVVERPANRLDFAQFKAKTPRIEFKKLWDSKWFRTWKFDFDVLLFSLHIQPSQIYLTWNLNVYDVVCELGKLGRETDPRWQPPRGGSGLKPMVTSK